MRYRLTLVVGCLLAVALARPFVAHADDKSVRCQVSASALRVRSVADLFAEAIARIHAGTSVSSLFDGVDPTHAPPQPTLFA